MTDHVYYICSHLTYLAIFHGMATFVGQRFPGVTQTLVLVDNPSFSDIEHARYLEVYDRVHHVAYAETTLTDNRTNNYRPSAVQRRVTDVRRSLSDARRFKFQPRSICFVSEMMDATLTVRLLMAKLRREDRDSKVLRLGTCVHRTSQHRTTNWLSWLENNLYVLLGAEPVSVEFFGGMMVQRRFYFEARAFDAISVLSNRWASGPGFSEIKYPAALGSSPRDRKYVLFLDHGTGWLSLQPEMPMERYIGDMNRVLAAITELYKDEDVDLLFKPHPRGHEYPYDLAGFTPDSRKVTAEMLFTEEAETIRAVYSVVSTGARTASLYGIPSYIFNGVFALPERMMDWNRRFLLDFSDVISVDRLEDLVLPPGPDREHSVSADDLDRLEETLKEFMAVNSA